MAAAAALPQFCSDDLARLVWALAAVREEVRACCCTLHLLSCCVWALAAVREEVGAVGVCGCICCRGACGLWLLCVKMVGRLVCAVVFVVVLRVGSGCCA